MLYLVTDPGSMQLCKEIRDTVQRIRD
uniref:Uncharacterized protein n=1 Tax=Arundo donax TaxID=35708 RepID=A0A0A9BFY5_ARUDO